MAASRRRVPQPPQHWSGSISSAIKPVAGPVAGPVVGLAEAARPLAEEDWAPAAAAPRLAFLLADLNTGGVQHAVIRIATAMATAGCRVTLLVCEPGGKLEAALPPSLRCVHLPKASKIAARLSALRADPTAWRLLRRPLLSRRETQLLPSLVGLTDYLRREPPDTLFSAAPALNVWAYLARRLAGAATRLVVSERSHFSSGKPRKLQRKQILAPMMRHAYARADQVVAVSHGVARDLVDNVGVAPEHITVLHNPTIGPDFASRMAAPVDHPWFAKDGPPVLLSVGRLAGQKDLPTLISAFAIARSKRELRLVLLGEKNATAAGKGDIHSLIEGAGVTEDVALLGYDPNPIRYMARADLFLLSSRFEGFPNVLLEAVAAGCPVVSTDCPSGPFELLDGGRYGRLVPVGDPEAMAAAILASLDEPHDKAALRARAALFDFDRSIEAYKNVLLGLPQDDTYPAPEAWR